MLKSGRKLGELIMEGRKAFHDIPSHAITTRPLLLLLTHLSTPPPLPTSPHHLPTSPPHLTSPHHLPSPPPHTTSPPHLLLDTVGYSSLLSALSRSKDAKAALRAEEVFNQMLSTGLKADTQASTIMITIWSKSTLPGKENKAQAIFERMLMSGDRPNAFTYTALLIMWTKSIQKNMRREGYRVYTPNAPPPPSKGEVVDINTFGETGGLASGLSLALEPVPGPGLASAPGQGLVPASAPGPGLGPSPVTITIEFAQTRIRDIYHRLWHEYVRMDGKAFCVLLVALGHAYPRAQALDEAEKLLDRLADFDMPPDAMAWCHLMNADGRYTVTSSSPLSL